MSASQRGLDSGEQKPQESVVSHKLFALSLPRSSKTSFLSLS